MSKQVVNKFAQRIIGKPIFRLDLHELFGPAPDWQQRLQRGSRYVVRETNLPYALGLLLLCSGITYAWWYFDPDSKLWPEMGGMALNVLFITIIFALFESRRERMQFEDRQQEVIDDYKRWDAPEARLRIAGAVRRLKRIGRTDIDLTGLRLTNFDFAREGIRDLSGSIFYDGTWGEPFKEHTVLLQHVSFDHLNCKAVVFSAMNPLRGLSGTISSFAVFQDCSFLATNLSAARFTGATLKWTDPPPASHFEYWTDEETDDSHRAQISYGPFDQADLTGTNFQDCTFINADFRGADNIAEAHFERANGLESAVFDDDHTKAAVLRSVQLGHK